MLEQIAHSRLALTALAALIVAAMAAFYMGRRRAVLLAAGNPRSLHSRPRYHGFFLAMWTLAPALAVLVVYALSGQAIADRLAMGDLPAQLAALPAFEQGVQVDTAKAVAGGALPASSLTGDLAVPVKAFADSIAASRGLVKLVAVGLAAALALAGLAYAAMRLGRTMRARNAVEGAIQILLLACSGVAVATTAGIILSLVFETFRFFQEVSPLEFFFGRHSPIPTPKPAMLSRLASCSADITPALNLISTGMRQSTNSGRYRISAVPMPTRTMSSRIRGGPPSIRTRSRRARVPSKAPSTSTCSPTTWKARSTSDFFMPSIESAAVAAAFLKATDGKP